MCFSSTASFGASAALLAIGIISMKNSNTKPQLVLSSIPLMLSAQQFFEGIVWLSLTQPAYAEWEKAATYIFLLFAQVVWPIFIPLSVMLLEKVPKRKKILSCLVFIGIIQSLYLVFGMAVYPVQSTIDGHHISYHLDFPGANRWFGGALYLIATGISPFVSSIKRLRLMGIIILFSYLFTRILYEYYVISVWCYFAALISLVVLAVTFQFKKETLSRGYVVEGHGS